ncbi:unnamed protein product [Vitrella brassicaformis CCMP3155]|uniref:Uncharacterized protein n=1 Tax=Vitrella brassicaformis (strain CCMP3155) TaxID=1169540 RepID=A0A0G4EXT1_VITBC|nr:unnamed protein product [Vitrella brassicaformis CCMP3155]|eukprot:CEM03526.1 unnamed protein product [Vitrella brassicaformis CCMP3155]
MASSSHQMPTTTPQPPAAPPAVPPLRSIAISKAADMAMSPHPDRRAKLRQCIDRLPQAEDSTMLTLVEQRIEEAIGRLGLGDVLVFDVGGLEDSLKVVHVLERGSGDEWQAMGRFIRLAAVYRLTPRATLPLRLSADRLPSPTAFQQLPLALAIYKTFSLRHRHMLTHKGQRLALQQADNHGAYRIGDESFRVVPKSELPAGHRYRSGLLWCWCYEEGVDQRMVLYTTIANFDPRYRRLLTEPISQQQGISVDYRQENGRHGQRHVVVSGFRPGETIAAYLWVGNGRVELWTTEASSATHRSHPLFDRFPTSMPRWDAVLRHFELAEYVINRGTVIE